MKYSLVLGSVAFALAGCATPNIDHTERLPALWSDFERYLDSDEALAAEFAAYTKADGNKAFARYINEGANWWATGYADDKLDMEAAEALALDLCHYFGRIESGCEIVHRQEAKRKPLSDELMGGLPDGINSYADAERFEAYLAAPGHKAIAGNEHGLYGYMIGADSQEEASAFALRECSENKPRYGTECTLIAVD